MKNLFAVSTALMNTNSSSSSCSVCNTTVYALEKITIKGNLFHKKCVRCERCSKILGPSDYVIVDNLFYCGTHRPSVRLSREITYDNNNFVESGGNINVKQDDHFLAPLKIQVPPPQIRSTPSSPEKSPQQYHQETTKSATPRLETQKSLFTPSMAELENALKAKNHKNSTSISMLSVVDEFLSCEQFDQSSDSNDEFPRGNNKCSSEAVVSSALPKNNTKITPSSLTNLMSSRKTNLMSTSKKTSTDRVKKDENSFYLPNISNSTPGIKLCEVSENSLKTLTEQLRKKSIVNLSSAFENEIKFPERLDDLIGTSNPSEYQEDLENIFVAAKNIFDLYNGNKQQNNRNKDTLTSCINSFVHEKDQLLNSMYGYLGTLPELLEKAFSNFNNLADKLKTNTSSLNNWKEFQTSLLMCLSLTALYWIQYKVMLPYSICTSESGYRIELCSQTAIFQGLLKKLEDFHLNQDMKNDLAAFLNSNRQLSTGHDFTPMIFRRFFYNREHKNYVYYDDKYGPLIITIRKEEGSSYFNDGIFVEINPIKMNMSNESSTSSFYRIIVRSRQHPDIKVLVPSHAIKTSLLRGKATPRDAIATILPNIQNSKLKRMPDSVESTASESLLKLDELEMTKEYKFGILYCKEGQTDESEMFGNEHGSEAFDDFLRVVGEKIELKGFSGFAGGLDTKRKMHPYILIYDHFIDNNTGTHAVYVRTGSSEIIFHVSTLMPYYVEDPQHIQRKRHIGNDIVSIIFIDGTNTKFSPSTIRSQFLHVFAVIQPQITPKNEKGYLVNFLLNNDVASCGPEMPFPPIFINKDKFRDFLIQKLINAECASYKAPKISKLLGRTKQNLFDSVFSETFGNVATSTNAEYPPLSELVRSTSGNALNNPQDNNNSNNSKSKNTGSQPSIKCSTSELKSSSSVYYRKTLSEQNNSILRKNRRSIHGSDSGDLGNYCALPSASSPSIDPPLRTPRPQAAPMLQKRRSLAFANSLVAHLSFSSKNKS